jgi:dimethylamine/trimethylamine dehydrogenase
VFAGNVTGDRLLVFDFDHYYLGGVIAEHLATSGKQVTYATPAGHASAWTFMTNELPFVYQALARAGVAIHTTTNLISFEGTRATVANLFNQTALELAVDGVVIVGHREPNDALFDPLITSIEASEAAGSVSLVGDAQAPGAIVHAVHSGHTFARGLVHDETSYLRDEPIVPTTPQIVFPR